VVQKSHLLDQMNQQLITSYFPSDASFKNCNWAGRVGLCCSFYFDWDYLF
jgi:hypothetical protein